MSVCVRERCRTEEGRRKSEEWNGSRIRNKDETRGGGKAGTELELGSEGSSDKSDGELCF
jgi:hypothetical protein